MFLNDLHLILETTEVQGEVVDIQVAQVTVAHDDIRDRTIESHLSLIRCRHVL